jgi:hypothetical protein
MATKAKAFRLDNGALGHHLSALRLAARDVINIARLEGTCDELATPFLNPADAAAWDKAVGEEDYHALCACVGIPTSRNKLAPDYFPTSKHVECWDALTGEEVVDTGGFRDKAEYEAMEAICRRADLALHLDADGYRQSLPVHDKAIGKGAACSIINAIQLGTSVRLRERGIDAVEHFEARALAIHIIAGKGDKSLGKEDRKAILDAIG